MKAFSLSCLLLFVAVGADQSVVSTTSSTDPTASPTSEQPSGSFPASPTSEQPSGSSPASPTSEQPSGSSPASPTSEQPSGSSPASPTSEQPSGSSTTSLPGSYSTQATNQTTTPGPVLSEPCIMKMCNGSSECINLNTDFFCLCPEGYYYKDSKCHQGKSFPGIITIFQDLSDLDNKNSINYQRLYFKVKKVFESAFDDDITFGQTVILNVQTLAISRSDIRSMGQVKVTVTNIFDRNSNIILEDVNKAIQNQIKEEGTISYQEENPCDFNGCSEKGGSCSDSLHCDCQEGLARPYPLSSCSVCSFDCDEKNNKQCIKRPDSQAPQCKCLPDYYDKEGTCGKCDFGYSGVGCKDNYILVFTVVCAIGGAILLGTIIGLIVLSSSNRRKKNTEEDSLIRRDFSNMKLETTGFNNPASSTGNLFPKVNTAPFPRVQSNMKSNPYEDEYFPRSMPARDY